MTRNPPFAARQQQAGISTVEFALTSLLFFMLLFGIVDFARIAWEFNSAAKATQMGARLAAVTPLVATGLRNYDGLAAAKGNGRVVPVGAVATVRCDSGGCSGDTLDMTRFTDIVNRLRTIYGRINAANVVVTYRHAGLGMAGNPIGPDILPMVTVELQGLAFVPITPGLTILSFNLPAFATTMTTEDP